MQSSKKELKFPIRLATPTVHYKVFEDNSGAALARDRNRTQVPSKNETSQCEAALLSRLLHPKRYHDQPYPASILLSQKLADYLTKPVNKEILKMLRPKVMGW
jgi:hypothetical protein